MYLQFKREVEHVLKAALADASYEYEYSSLELEESEHADITSRIAFTLAARYRKPPENIAADILRHITVPTPAEGRTRTLISRAVASGPYINFYVNDSFLDGTLRRLKGGGGNTEKRHDKSTRIIIEHTSANPDGPLHIGHLRNAIIGDVLARVLTYSGYQVETQYYVNDMGRQVAVAVWGASRLKLETRKKGDYAIVDVYIAANRLLEANAAYRTEVDALMRRYEAGDEEVVKRYEEVVQRCLAGIKASLQRLNIHHDLFVFESEFVRSGAVQHIIEELKRKGDIKSEGSALILHLDGIEKGLVIQRADGTSLYTTRDLAYHRWKSERCDRMIDVLGKDHELVSQQLRKALLLLGVKAPEFVIFEFVSLPSGSLSTRAGRYISADELMEKIEARAYEEVEKRRRDLSEDKKREIARMVGIGALRYDMVKVSPEKHIVFNLEDALDIEKKGAPFIQYAHARASSILRMATDRGFKIKDSADTNVDVALLRDKSEVELIKKLAMFEYVMESAASELKLHKVARYARELAEVFNIFYKNCPVLNAEEELREARLVLVDCTKQVLCEVLSVLGIEAPEEM